MLLIVEFKLDKNIPFDKQKKKKNYLSAVEQLQTYCQLKRAPYGILLTEKMCGMNVFEYTDSDVKRTMINKLPNIFASNEDEVSENSQKNVSTKPSVSKPIFQKYWPYGLVIILGIAVGYGGFTLYHKNTCTIIGNVSAQKDGSVTKYYHTKRSPYYESTKFEPDKGEKMFCSEEEAVAAGWQKSYDKEEWEDNRECNIKGIVDAAYDELSNDQSLLKVYYTPHDVSYDQKELYESRGDTTFCSEREAVAAGFRRAFDSE